MLEIAPSLSASLPVLSSTAGAPAPVAAGAGDFARALADASLDTAPASDRQDLAAPGKTALAALPGIAPADAKPGSTPVSRVLPTKPAPIDPGEILLDPAPLATAPGDGASAVDDRPATTDEAAPEPPLGQPVSGYLQVVLMPPTGASVDADPIVADGIATATAPTPTIAVPAQPPRPTVQGTPADVSPVAPKPVPAPDTPVSRRLSFKLDPSVEVIDAGRPTAPAPVDQPPVERPALKLVTRDLPPAIPLAPKPEATVASNAPQPAAHAFARAIAQAQPRPTRIEPRADVTDIQTAAQAIAAGEARPVVLATRALDTTREDWPQRLIDRVEAARDAANAADTRIRLVPEALGKIDIALRQEGATLHVHFSADQAATRDLLAQAQPRLAELAEARGLRLGQTGVDGGSGDQQRRPPGAGVAFANRPARAIVAEQASTPGDDRLA